MKRATKQGFTLVEIMIVVAIIALLAAIAIPNVLRGRTTANESAAIGNMRALLSSLEMYRSVYQAYPTAFKNDMYTLPEPDFGPPSFNKALGGTTGVDTVQGYTYTYANTICGGAASPDAYCLTAVPSSTSTGSRQFLVNEQGLIHHCSVSGTATVKPGDATIDQSPANCA